MSLEEYLLVEWVGEDKYSAVSRKSLVEEEFRILNGEQLIGLTLSFLWGRARTEYKGKVIQYGSKIDMQHEVETYARSAVRESQHPIQSRVNISDSSLIQNASGAINLESSGTGEFVRKLSSIREVLSNVQDSSEIPLSEGTDPTNNALVFEKNLEQQLTEALKKAAKYKNLAKKRGKRIVELEVLQSNFQEFVDIGNGVRVEKAELNAVKTLSDSPNVFARNLMRLLFKEDELVSSSLFGKQCNANKSTPALTELDPVRRDAIIPYTLKSFGYVIENVSKRKDPLLKDVKRSMSDFLREKKQKLHN